MQGTLGALVVCDEVVPGKPDCVRFYSIQVTMGCCQATQTRGERRNVPSETEDKLRICQFNKGEVEEHTTVSRTWNGATSHMASK